MTRPLPTVPGPGGGRRTAGAARGVHARPSSRTEIPTMRAAALTALCLLAAAAAAAQDTAIVIHPESAGVTLRAPELPRLVAEEAIRFYNAPTTTRLVGRTRLPRGNEWRGDVAVRNGSVAVAGRIAGTLLVIDGDATLDSTAVITGDFIVIGGAVTRAPAATVSGEVRLYREPLGYRTQGDEIALAPSSPRRLLRNVGAQKTWGAGESRSSLTIATGGTFNRIEGLPVVFGPLFDWRVRENVRLRLDALGIFRTAGDLSGRAGDLGYMLRSELRSGDGSGAGVELRAYSIIAPVEDWGLRSAEVGWAAFLLQRDYRDYYVDKGAAGRVFFQPNRGLTLALEVRRDGQTTTPTQDPWTVFRNNQAWRPNPPIDDGHYTTVGATATIDTRNDRLEPSSGWYARAQLENGRSEDVSPQSGVPTAVRRPIPTDGSYQFTRAFLDVRRYTRVSPSGRVNLRLVAGGWLGGDPLPLQRRLSIGGPDPLAGYRFRASGCNGNILDPAFAGTLVAACDRVILTQVEYRGHLSLHWGYKSSRPEDETGKSLFALQGPDLVVLGDAGQAWLVGTGPGRLPSDRLPTLGSWLADLGLGVDWGGLGFYAAKGVTSGERLRFTIRLDHRF